jgi:ribosomal protein S17
MDRHTTKIIEKHNSTPHTALDNITPNQAIIDTKKRKHVMHLNKFKAHDNGFVTDLTPGDKVRIDDTSLFKKGTESRRSDEVHVVKEASGKTVTLSVTDRWNHAQTQ